MCVILHPPGSQFVVHLCLENNRRTNEGSSEEPRMRRLEHVEPGPPEAIETTSRVGWASPALGHQGLGTEPAWAASGGQLLTLLGAAAPAGEEEQPGCVSVLIHDPQAWLGASAPRCLPECVTGNPLTDRLPEGVGGEQSQLGRV